mmetsp:Transcript_4115/g.11872  ORF Transcript_4115/g.11872 Transcript_4115/m.11872 type:complete len:158 (-) Transcript_4115:799-1272(-)
MRTSVCTMPSVFLKSSERGAGGAPADRLEAHNSASLCANPHSAPMSQARPSTMHGHIFVQRKSGNGFISASEWAKLQDARFLHLPAKKNLHIFVLRNLFLLTGSSDPAAGVGGGVPQLPLVEDRPSLSTARAAEATSGCCTDMGAAGATDGTLLASN